MRMLLAVPILAAALVSAAVSPAWGGRVPAMAFLGDSWTVGVGSSTGANGYAPRTAERLGWESLNFGVAGSGYTRPGPYRSLFSQRVAKVVAARPDVIVVEGSLNDRDSSPAAVTDAAYRTLHALHAETTARIIVLGACYNPGTPTATINWINRSVSVAAGRVGVPFVDPTGWLSPKDPSVWWNSLHPNDKGHQLVADHLAPVLRTLLLR